jgi:hypothetical protein
MLNIFRRNSAPIETYEDTHRMLSVYIPNESPQGTIDSSTQEALASGLAVQFGPITGGASVSVVSGVWASPERGIVQEHTLRVDTYCSPENFDNALSYAMQFSRMFKTVFDQDSVLVSHQPASALFV